MRTCMCICVCIIYVRLALGLHVYMIYIIYIYIAQNRCTVATEFETALVVLVVGSGRIVLVCNRHVCN